VRGEDVLVGARAAGAMVLPHERRTLVLLVVAAPIHLAISLGWAAVMAVALPHGREPARGVVGAMVIAALDLALIGRRIPSIAALPQGRQWADHAAYGLAVGLVLRARRSRRAGGRTGASRWELGRLQTTNPRWHYLLASGTTSDQARSRATTSASEVGGLLPSSSRAIVELPAGTRNHARKGQREATG
jgi:hypothetical protein